MSEFRQTIYSRCSAFVAAAERLERIALEFPEMFAEYVQFRTGSSVFHGMTNHEAAAQVLKEMQRPMRTAEIADHLLKRGFGVGELNLRNSLFTAMSRHSDTFDKPSPGLWSLKSEQPPTETGE